jgi:hypothetical protein
LLFGYLPELSKSVKDSAVAYYIFGVVKDGWGWVDEKFENEHLAVSEY